MREWGRRSATDAKWFGDISKPVIHGTEEKENYARYRNDIDHAIDRAGALLAEARKTDRQRPVWDFEANDEARAFLHDTLMDLSRYEALKMKTKSVGDEEYLFIEVGGFSTRNPVGWQSSWHVMKKLSD